jgi:hypothetical protein
VIETTRYINWFEHASRSIASRFPQTAGCSDYVTERLAALLLEHLPQDLAVEIVDLLPPSLGRHSWPFHLSHPAERISHGDFIRRAGMTLACAEMDLPPVAQGEFAREVADIFLWSMCQELPASLKAWMTAVLPEDLRSRMDLYGAISDESRVA